MIKALGHFITITRHRHKVISHCRKAGIFWQGLRHDLSKYSLTEFVPGARFYTGKRSPNDGERAQFGYSLAWMHHKGRNRHHFEYWTDYNPKEHRLTPVKMPLRYVIEMFCDRVAASKIYMGADYSIEYPLAYFERGQAPKSMHPETCALIRRLLTMLKDEGEDAVFFYIRHTLLPRKDY